MTNTGKPSEAAFEAMYARRGKLAFVYRFPDAAELYGLNHDQLVIMKKQPADYLITDNGDMYYAEVKSTNNPTSFSKSQIEEGQWFAAVRQTAARGKYFFFIHALKLQRWFRVPAEYFVNSIDRSYKWSDLERFRIS